VFRVFVSNLVMSGFIVRRIPPDSYRDLTQRIFGGVAVNGLRAPGKCYPGVECRKLSEASHTGVGSLVIDDLQGGTECGA
jgi:hypothetical protein